MTAFPILVPIAAVLLVAVVFHWLPSLWRPGLFFGITVPPDYRGGEEARETLRRYRLEMWAWSAVAVALGLIVLLRGMPGLFVAATAIQVGGAFAAFVRGQRRTRPAQAPLPRVRTAELISAPARFRGYLAAALVPFGFLTASALYLHAHWQAIPARFPIHYNASGVPNGWAERTWRGVYGMLIIGAGPLLLIVMIVAAMVLGARPTPGSRDARLRTAVLRLVLGLEYAMGAVFAVLPLSMTGVGFHLPLWLPLVLIPAVIVVFIWPLIRISQQPEDAPKPVADERWKWGDFYYNPEDPALLVEKRFGAGYTFNFANKWAWVFLAAIVLIPVATVVIAFG